MFVTVKKRAILVVLSIIIAVFGVIFIKNRQPVQSYVLGKTVVIDAGHGGRDGGATALSAMPEKDLNLDIALAVRDYLSAAGIDVIMTRTEDVMLTDGEGGTNKNQDLRARKKIAESTENAVFVSIHMNSFPIEKYYGLQVYYSDNNEKSKALAASIQEKANTTLCQGSNRKIKNAGDSIYLLDELTCPAILIECGFLSNEAEALKLNDPEYRRKMAFLSRIYCRTVGRSVKLNRHSRESERLDVIYHSFIIRHELASAVYKFRIFYFSCENDLSVEDLVWIYVKVRDSERFAVVFANRIQLRMSRTYGGQVFPAEPFREIRDLTSPRV